MQTTTKFHPPIEGDMELALIDAIGPFFRGYQKRRINWSKIPFAHLATAGPERETQWRAIRADLDNFARRPPASATMPFRSTTSRIFPITLGSSRKSARAMLCFARNFAALFALLSDHGLRIYLTADFVTTSAAVDGRLRGAPPPPRRGSAKSSPHVWTTFPRLRASSCASARPTATTSRTLSAAA